MPEELINLRQKTKSFGWMIPAVWGGMSLVGFVAVVTSLMTMSDFNSLPKVHLLACGFFLTLVSWPLYLINIPIAPRGFIAAHRHLTWLLCVVSAMLLIAKAYW